MREFIRCIFALFVLPIKPAVGLACCFFSCAFVSSAAPRSPEITITPNKIATGDLLSGRAIGFKVVLENRTGSDMVIQRSLSKVRLFGIVKDSGENTLLFACSFGAVRDYVFLARRAKGGAINPWSKWIFDVEIDTADLKSAHSLGVKFDFNSVRLEITTLQASDSRGLIPLTIKVPVVLTP